MKKDDLKDLKDHFEGYVRGRRSLGGYSTDAEAILTLAETISKILNHMVETCPELKGKKNDTSKKRS